ncbi:MAG: alpha-amylase family glycosyl hydrolase [Bacteroidales bacterium]
MKRLIYRVSIIAGLAGLFLGFNAVQAQKEHRYPEWAKNAVIYEVNVRQHTTDGKFISLIKDLPRLKQLGVDILWLMPVHPIGELNRKGPLGSYYSVKDYEGLNPEFGTKSEFQLFMKAAHDQGFKVILDWVANHSSWDNLWMSEHPDWYQRDKDGKYVSPYDWTDVVNLDYNNYDMRKAMIEAMRYWVTDFDVDGFRCDVAGLVPKDFWEDARKSLEKTKPLFMLAEDEDNIKLCQKAFDMNYGWKMHHHMTKVAKGEIKPIEIIKLQRVTDSLYPKDAIKMNFVTNHDENSWNGTVAEKFGEGARAMTLLSFTLPGMPLLYTGQEIDLNRRLKFFEKDTISWSFKHELTDFYKKLTKLRHDYNLFWSPPYGGSFKALKYNGPENVLSFVRKDGKQKAIVLVNMSRVPTSVRMADREASGNFTEYFSMESKVLGMGTLIDLPAWGYKVYISR